MTDLQLAKVSHLMLGVRDVQKSLEFYAGTLGMKTVFQTAEMAFLEAGGISLVLSQALAGASDTIVGATEVVFTVADVASAHRQLSKLGVEFINEPRQVTDQEWAANFVDPDGHRLSVFGPRESD